MYSESVTWSRGRHGEWPWHGERLPAAATWHEEKAHSVAQSIRGEGGLVNGRGMRSDHGGGTTCQLWLCHVGYSSRVWWRAWGVMHSCRVLCKEWAEGKPCSHVLQPAVAALVHLPTTLGAAWHAPLQLAGGRHSPCRGRGMPQECGAWRTAAGCWAGSGWCAPTPYLCATTHAHSLCGMLLHALRAP